MNWWILKREWAMIYRKRKRMKRSISWKRNKIYCTGSEVQARYGISRGGERGESESEYLYGEESKSYLGSNVILIIHCAGLGPQSTGLVR